ncbi:MAG TPA: hypothetical protein VMV81_13305, partial [Phycisphaerae bacterium]|nr:hypothetical protein [Phycisphaerae bacterium]
IAEGTLNIQGYSLTVNGSTGKFVIERGGILKLDSGAVITTSTYSPEVQCGSMVAVNSGSTFLFPSNTTAQISGTGGNTNWTLTQTCVQGDTPAYCPGTKSKVTSWREVKNAS